MRTAGIICAAGQSLRMGDFKPLMRLNGFEMIRLTVQAMLDGGVDHVCVVVGHRGQEIVQALHGFAVNFVENHDFAQTDMLFSVQMGLRALLQDEDEPAAGYGAVLIAPGDAAAFSSHTVAALLKRAGSSKAALISPRYKEGTGHPLLLRRELFELVLGYEGHGGLRAALAACEPECVELDDEGILLDADDPEAFALLEAYVRGHKGVSDEVVEELFEAHGTLPNIRAHCWATSVLCERMVCNLNGLGLGLDFELCRSSAALHDIERVKPRHAQAGADALHARGYHTIAQIVARHNDGLELGGADAGSDEMLNEANLVFLADKLMKEDQLVSLDVRYAPALEEFLPSTEIGRRCRMDKASCTRLLDRYTELTGDRLL